MTKSNLSLVVIIAFAAIIMGTVQLADAAKPTDPIIDEYTDLTNTHSNKSICGEVGLERTTTGGFDFKVWEDNSFILDFDTTEEYTNADGETVAKKHTTKYQKGSFDADVKTSLHGKEVVKCMNGEKNYVDNVNITIHKDGKVSGHSD